jgi:hypothetical protein
VSTPTLAERIMGVTDARNAKLKTIANLRKTIKQAKKGIAQGERKLRRLENSLLPTSLEAKPEPINFDRVADKKEIEVAKIVAARLREARLLCDHKTGEAAALLGVTSCDLQKIEGVIGVDYIPLWLIKKAAETYCVPVDFLFGIIDDWDAADGEVFLSRNHLAALQRQQLEDFTKSAASQMQQNLRLTALNSGVAAAVMAVQHIIDAFNQFRHLNPVKFLDMPGGARLVRQVEIAEDLVAHATCVLTHYKALPESLMAHADYMFKTFPEQNGYFPKE